MGGAQESVLDSSTTDAPQGCETSCQKTLATRLPFVQSRMPGITIMHQTPVNTTVQGRASEMSVVTAYRDAELKAVRLSITRCRLRLNALEQQVHAIPGIEIEFVPVANDNLRHMNYNLTKYEGVGGRGWCVASVLWLLAP